MTRRLEVLDRDACVALLRTGYLGRLAFVADGRPKVLPMNYRLHDDAVVVRTEHGALLEAVAGRPVAFEVDAVDPGYHTGWSVVVEGTAVEVTDASELAEVERLPLRPWAPGERSRYLRIPLDEVSGRRIA
jgi:uncharacterized protein